MGDLLPLASALGLGMLAGARLYATVFAIGLLLRFDWVALPAVWQHAAVLADTRVLIVSGIVCLADREAMFLSRKWGRLVAHQIGPLTAIEIEDGLLVDEMVLVLTDGLRRRFTLLAGQLESARDELKRLSPPTLPGARALNGQM